MKGSNMQGLACLSLPCLAVSIGTQKQKPIRQVRTSLLRQRGPDRAACTLDASKEPQLMAKVRQPVALGDSSNQAISKRSPKLPSSTVSRCRTTTRMAGQVNCRSTSR